MQVEKIYYRHYRYYDYGVRSESPLQDFPYRYFRSGKNRSRWMPTTRGGKTEAVAVVTYGGHTYEIVSTAKCRPDENFCYKTGRDYAKYRLDLLLGHIKAMENRISELNDES